MSKYFIYSVYFTALLFAQQDYVSLYKKIEPSVVAIIVYDKNNDTISLGSGFYINTNGEIIINAHVLNNAYSAVIRTSENKIFPITKVLGYNHNYDLIKLQANVGNTTTTPLFLSNSLPEAGSKIIVIGSPLGLEKTITDGIVSAIRPIPSPYDRMIQISAPLSPGSSGSPVINMNNQVIGIATWQYTEGQNINFAIPVSLIFKLDSMDFTFINWVSIQRLEKQNVIDSISMIGHVLYGQGKYEEAIPFYESAASIDSNQFESYSFLGECYRQIGKYSRAEEILNYAINYTQDSAYSTSYYLLGRLYCENFQLYPEAIVLLNKSIQLQDSIWEKYCCWEAHLYLGLAYIKINDQYNAIKEWKQTLKYNPNAQTAYTNLGLVYYEQKRYYDAINAFKQAIKIDPTDTETQLTLGKMYVMVGDYDSALKMYKILENLDPIKADELFNDIY